VLFHASYVVICYASNDCDILTINENELVAKCRLGTAVKKTILLSYFDKESGPKYDKSEKTVKFKVLKWTGSNSSTESIVSEHD
jgi:tRNA splicing endonuclease